MKNTRYARPLGLAPLLLALLVLLPACDSDESDGASAEVTVMTYNLYLGADLFDLVGLPADQVPAVAAQLFAGVQATDFEARAGAIADIVAEQNPGLVGLQEVSLYRTQTPSDILAGVEEPNATEVAFDFLSLLQAALEARGLDYRVAATTENADVELPSTTDGMTFTDIRLTDRDVILARSDVQTSGAIEMNFSLAAPVPIGAGEAIFTRGYNSVRATVDEVTFTFANTHLEVDDENPAGAAAVQAAQAAELVGRLSSALSPVVLVGDFNSRADGMGTVVTLPDPFPFTGTTYGLLTNAYTDAAAEAGATGNTCCQAVGLDNATSSLTQRIDLILYRGDVEALSAEVVGDEPGDRVDVGGEMLWPSDHAGVVATLRVQN